MNEKQELRLVLGILFTVAVLALRIPLLWYIVALVALIGGEFGAAAGSFLIALVSHGMAMSRQQR